MLRSQAQLPVQGEILATVQCEGLVLRVSAGAMTQLHQFANQPFCKILQGWRALAPFPPPCATPPPLAVCFA